MNANMPHCKMCVQMARRQLREAIRIRRDAAMFTNTPSRDKMFYLAGQAMGRALGYMAEARANHPTKMSAKWRRTASRAA